MNLKAPALKLGLGACVALIAACSNPPAGTERRGSHRATVPKEVKWRDPVVATTLEQNPMPSLGRLTGSFQIVNGCLSFVREGEVYVPVFNRRAPPVVSPSGLVWGGRTLKYGQTYMMGGGSRPPSLVINEEARRTCRGTFLMIQYFAG